MRNDYHLQERHLHECVRRNVISPDQMEAILAVARGMAAQEDGGAPDFTWVSVVQGAAAMMSIAIPSIYLVDKVNRFHVTELLAVSLVASAFFFGVGYLLRRNGWGRVPASIMFAGGAMFTWGIGTALYFGMFSGTGWGAFYDYSGSYSYEVIRIARDKAYLAGAVVALLSSFAVGRYMKIAAAGATAMISLVYLAMGGAELMERMRGSSLSDSEAVPWLVMTGVAGVAIARLFDKKTAQSTQDPAFWMYGIGVLPLGLAGVINIDRQEELTPVWLFLAMVVGYLGMRWNRKPLLAAAAAAVMIYPAYGFAEARFDGTFVAGVLACSGAIVAIAATVLRRYFYDRWSAGTLVRDERTVWC